MIGRVGSCWRKEVMVVEISRASRGEMATMTAEVMFWMGGGVMGEKEGREWIRRGGG